MNVRHTYLRSVATMVMLAALALVSAACPGSNPTTPTPTNPPTISAVTPANGPASGGTTITVSGTNFVGTPVVIVGGVLATDVRPLGTTVLTASTPPHAAGIVDVTVSTSGGSVTATSAFTYVAVPPPTVTAVSPMAGSIAGGTVVTITGTNFSSGATVSFGGVAATAVEVLSGTLIRATTGPHAAGVVDVVVSAGGQAGTLGRGFTYQAADNTPPRITAIGVQGTRTNEPASFADVGEEVMVTATVVDAETPASQLTYVWTADGGTFTGTGATVRWKAPTGITTPAQLRLTLTVSEPAQDGQPSPVLSATMTTAVRVHDSPKEIADLSVRFLIEFSEQRRPPAEIVRDFWDGCPGKMSEFEDVTKNQANYTITSFVVGPVASSTVAFGGTCPFRAKRGDGCVQTPVLWKSVYRPTNSPETASGTDQTTAVYRENRWWLCDSDFNGSVSNPIAAVPFIR